ncbi:MAG: 1,2-phenylacetyl-CoA epoxidase subunit PaaC [Bacteroidota bacterium]
MNGNLFRNKNQQPTTNNMKEAHFDYTLQLADNALILGQRLSEWCGHGPVLEQDIALTNIALDLMGQARSLFEYAAKFEDKGRTEDSLAFLRIEREYKNVLLVEQANEDFAYTIVRQFLFDAFHFYQVEALLKSKDETLAAIAAKSIKEITYHLRFSSEWMIRLGDGTEISHHKIQEALDDLWMYTGEFFIPSTADLEMLEEGIAPDLETLKVKYYSKIDEILKRATLSKPEAEWMQEGGKKGMHSENMGFILAEMQYMQRAYPGLEW